MKKVIFILILVLSIASIAVINFFGLVINVEEKRYISKIELENLQIMDGDEVITVEDPDPMWSAQLKGDTYIFDFIEPEDGAKSYDRELIDENPNAVYLNINILPDNADNKSLKISVAAGNESTVVIREDITTVYFLKKGLVTITVEAMDGSPAKLVFMLYAR